MQGKKLSSWVGAGLVYGSLGFAQVSPVAHLQDINGTGEKPRLVIVPPAFQVPSLDVVQSFQVPANKPGGLTFADDSLWLTDQSEARIYQLDSVTGEIKASFASPDSNPIGLGYDGEFFWNVDAETDQIYKLQTDGQVIESFPLPTTISSQIKDPLPQGLTIVGDNIWLVDILDGRVYQINFAGELLGSFATPGLWSRGLTFDGQNFWLADQSEHLIYKLDADTGAVVDSFVSPGVSPEGLAFDGDSLWNVDGKTGKVYRLKPAQLAAGEQKEINFEVTNSETGTLLISSISITGDDAAEFTIINDACNAQPLTTGQSCSIRLRFSPVSNGEKSASMNLVSNDFKTPITSVSLGGFVGGESTTRFPDTALADLAATGLWWNSKKAGQGYSLHQVGDQLAMVWYTYKEDNTPIWYLASGPKSGDGWQAPLKQYHWDGTQAEPTSVGNVSIQFNNPESGILDWQLGEHSGQEPIRLFQLAPAEINSKQSGLYFDKNQPGWGWSVSTQGVQEASALYFYDQAGEPRWVLGGNEGADVSHYALKSYWGTCPACSFVASVPLAAGSMSRQFTAAATATLTTHITLQAPLSGKWDMSDVAVIKADR